VTNVAPAASLEPLSVTRYALGGWALTIRLCAIRLAQAAPLITWLILRR
jgi:hypothetical protein